MYKQKFTQILCFYVNSIIILVFVETLVAAGGVLKSKLGWLCLTIVTDIAYAQHY